VAMNHGNGLTVPFSGFFNPRTHIFLSPTPLTERAVAKHGGRMGGRARLGGLAGEWGLRWRLGTLGPARRGSALAVAPSSRPAMPSCQGWRFGQPWPRRGVVGRGCRGRRATTQQRERGRLSRLRRGSANADGSPLPQLG
jgi:hypothetical protein